MTYNDGSDEQSEDDGRATIFIVVLMIGLMVFIVVCILGLMWP